MRVVILAGGKGSRLWPLSRESFPKQFLCFGESLSLFQSTVKRALMFCPLQNLLIVTNRAYASLVSHQIRELGYQEEAMLLIEGEGRNTAPSLLASLCFFQDKGVSEEEEILFMPSDSFISPLDRWVAAVDEGRVYAQNHIVLLGVSPTRADTGFGYLLLGKEDLGLFHVRQFIEKPPIVLAEELYMETHVLWNTGHLLASSKVLWQEIEQHSSSLAKARSMTCQEVLESFSSWPEISIDHALLEKSSRLIAYPMDLTWSDVGSWDSIYDLYAKDANNNVTLGKAHAVETKRCMLFASSRKIVAHQVEDLCVVETEDLLYVGKRGKSQLVRELQRVPGLDQDVLTATFVTRPWGSYTVLHEQPGMKIKKIYVLPGSRLSLQMHEHRKEHWMILQGEAFVELEEEQYTLTKEESIIIPLRARHRLSNRTLEPLEVLEVQSGEILSEEDIIRLEDDYARITCITP